MHVADLPGSSVMDNNGISEFEIVSGFPPARDVSDGRPGVEGRIPPLTFVPPALAIEFLAFYGRMEYALKCAGYVSRQHARLEPKWTGFAKAIDWEFRRIRSNAFKEAVELLLTQPPLLQVAVNGRLEWRVVMPSKYVPRAQQVLSIVLRVRSNLFHGSRAGMIGTIDTDRESGLIKASIVVLRHCAALDPAVDANF